MPDRRRWASFALALALAACGQDNGAVADSSDLPGSAEFPLVAVSTVVACPASWSFPDTPDARGSHAPVCVAAPKEANSGVVVAYQRSLDERGFRFGRYLDSPSVVMLVRPEGDDCDLMIFGLPYLPEDQRSKLVLMFKLQKTSAKACAQIEREGRG